VRLGALGDLDLVAVLVRPDRPLVLLEVERQLGPALPRRPRRPRLAAVALLGRGARCLGHRHLGGVVVRAGRRGHVQRVVHPGRAAPLDVAHRQRAGLAALAAGAAVAPRSLAPLGPDDEPDGLVLLARVRSGIDVLLLERRRLGLLELADLFVLAADLLAGVVVALLRRRRLAVLLL